MFELEEAVHFYAVTLALDESAVLKFEEASALALENAELEVSAVQISLVFLELVEQEGAEVAAEFLLIQVWK